MKERVYNKLVRDKIPEIIEQQGKQAITRKASDKEYIALLMDKLSEEVEEFKATPNEEELADILEVIDALVKTMNFSLETVGERKGEKAAKRGSFLEGIVLEKVIEDE